MADDPKPRDWWDKAEILGKLITPVLAGILAIGLGFFADYQLDKQRRSAEAAQTERQRQDSNARLLLQLASQREESESALRKDMFTQIIEQFLRVRQADAAAKTARDPTNEDWETLRKHVLNLEILTYNFHNSLDIGPLFRDLEFRLRRKAEKLDAGARKCEKRPDEVPKDGCLLEVWRQQLEEAARDVTTIQVNALDTGHNVRRAYLYTEDVNQEEGFLDAFAVQEPDTKAAGEATDSKAADQEADKPADNKPRPRARWEVGDYTLEADIVRFDREARSVEVAVRTYHKQPTPPESAAAPPKAASSNGDTPNAAPPTEAADTLVQGVAASFWVSFFDFPMIDNLRMSEGERLAVVLREFTDFSIALDFIVFDGSRASLKDRPYYEEVADQIEALNKRSQ